MSFNAYLGLSLGTLFTMIGTSFSTTKAVGLMAYDFTSFIPIIMSNALILYWIIVSILIVNKLSDDQLDGDDVNALMSVGLITGFSNLFSGITMGYMNQKASVSTNEVNRGVVIGLLFAKSWGLCGLIVGLLIVGTI